MKQRYLFFVILFGLVFSGFLLAEDVVVTTPDFEVSEGLDLQAVAEIFKDSENLEAFEQNLNDPEMGINNLDLNEDGYVDFIRVLEDVEDGSHLIVLQAVLGDDEYQDVATIEVDKTGEESYDMQIHGNEALYGADYYIAPAVVHIHTWPIVAWIYRPLYHPYRSVYYWGVTPKWWVRRHCVAHTHYRAKVVTFHTRKTFVAVSKPRVTHHRIVYKPHTSTVVKKTTVLRKPGGTTVRKSTTVRKTPSGDVKVKKTVTKRSADGKKTVTKKTTVKHKK